MMMPTATGCHRSIVASALVACACGLAVTACGSSGSGGKDGNSRAANYQSFLNYSKCMRAHGLPNFPDPSAGGGIQISPSEGVNPSSPAFQSAQKTCQHLLPGGGPGNQKPTEQDKQRMLALANCMRAHGLTNFPDPTTGQPNLGAGGPGQGAIIGINGLFFNLGAAGLNPQSPAFEHAAEACNFPGAGRLGNGKHPPVVAKGG
jgi:hypothetical protein